MSARTLYGYRDFLTRCGIGLGVTAAVCTVMGLLSGIFYLGWLQMARLLAPLGVNPGAFWIGMVLALFVIAGLTLALALLVGRAADGRADE